MGAGRAAPLAYRKNHRPREEDLSRVTQPVSGRHRPSSLDSCLSICLIFFLLYPMTSLIAMGSDGP